MKNAVWLISLVAIVGAHAEEIHVFAGRENEAVIYNNRGNTLLSKGDLYNARRNFDAAIRIDPTMWPAFVNRARVSATERKWASVINDCNAAMRLKPNFLHTALLRAEGNEHLGQYATSLSDINRVLDLRPDKLVRSRALNRRAWIWSVCPDPAFRHGRKAVADATTACELTGWKNAHYIDTLAAAYAEAGDFDRAVRYQQQAMALPLSSNDEKLTGAGERLSLYQRRKPFRQRAG